jgi:arylsulfatase
MAAWDSLPADEKAFHARQMEVYAGFMEHTDTWLENVDELERLGLRNTLIFYVFSDNGARPKACRAPSATKSRPMPSPRPPSKASRRSTPCTVVWAHWGGRKSGSTTTRPGPGRASRLLGTRWPATLAAPACRWRLPGQQDCTDKEVRSQFHHVNDIASTIYDVGYPTARNPQRRQQLP